MATDERAQFKRQIQRLCKRVAADCGFDLYKRTFMVKEDSDIVGMIVFDFPPSAMQFHVAAQPLYIPAQFLQLSFGYKVMRPNLAQRNYWGSYVDCFDDDIDEIEAIIYDEALPFLESVSSPQKLIDFLQHDSWWPPQFRFPPHKRDMYIGYSLLMMKECGAAVAPLTSAWAALSKYERHIAEATISPIEHLLSLLEAKNYAAIDAFLSETILETKKACELKTV